MKLGILKDIDWAYVGALLANEDGDKQTVFLRHFIKECKSWGTSFQIGVQLAEISQNLTDEEKEVLSQITYREEDS